MEGGVSWAQQLFGCLRDFLHLICLLIKYSGFVLELGACSQSSLLGQKDVKPVMYFNIFICHLRSGFLTTEINQGAQRVRS